MRYPKIGDPVEVMVMRREPVTLRSGPAPEDAPLPTPEWWPATITYVDGNQIGVAFSDGERVMLQRGSTGYRLLRT